MLIVEKFGEHTYKQSKILPARYRQPSLSFSGFIPTSPPESRVVLSNMVASSQCNLAP